MARLQQRDGLLRPQPERCYGPWPDAGLGSGPGHGAGHGAGRHGSVAPAGQPGDGEAVAVRLEAGRFGQELRLGAVGVFSIRLPVGRRQACPGVLAPEDQVSFDLGGVQDEHGFVRCCVGVSVCYGAGIWQGPGGFQKQLGWTERISRGAGRGFDGFLVRAPGNLRIAGPAADREKPSDANRRWRRSRAWLGGLRKVGSRGKDRSLPGRSPFPPCAGPVLPPAIACCPVISSCGVARTQLDRGPAPAALMALFLGRGHRGAARRSAGPRHPAREQGARSDPQGAHDAHLDTSKRSELAARIERVNQLANYVTRTRRRDIEEFRVIREPKALYSR